MIRNPEAFTHCVYCIWHAQTQKRLESYFDFLLRWKESQSDDEHHYNRGFSFQFQPQQSKSSVDALRNVMGFETTKEKFMAATQRRKVYSLSLHLPVDVRREKFANEFRRRHSPLIDDFPFAVYSIEQAMNCLWCGCNTCHVELNAFRETTKSTHRSREKWAQFKQAKIQIWLNAEWKTISDFFRWNYFEFWN